MLTNEILEEIYQYREAQAKSFNYDVSAMFKDLRARQAQSGKPSVSLPPKQPVAPPSSSGVR
ncbi:hypothetical protein NIES2101_33490 [Calothrix sp. HK-06]|nr:hypothetical protein NIES2101_33490 [Calothrix sp. HK-06]